MTFFGVVVLWVVGGIVAAHICHVIDYFFCGRFVQHEPFTKAYGEVWLLGIIASPTVIFGGIPVMLIQAFKYMNAHNWRSIKTLRFNFEFDKQIAIEQEIIGTRYTLVMGKKWATHICTGRSKSFESHP